MPTCPKHPSERLEPKRKGWFCEECGAVVVSHEAGPAPADALQPGSSTVDTDATSDDEAIDVAVVDDADLAAAARQSLVQTLSQLDVVRPSAARYVVRSGVDDLVLAALERAGRALMVLGEPGTGKTALLSRLAEKLAGLDNQQARGAASDVVVLVPFPLACAPNEDVHQPVLRAAGQSRDAFRSLAELADHLGSTMPQGARMWWIFDGIDEVEGLDGRLASLEALVRGLQRWPWLRLVVSLRPSCYEALQATRKSLVPSRTSLFDDPSLWVTFYDERLQVRVPYLELRPFEISIEGRAAYEASQTRAPDRSAKIAWSELSPRIRQLLATPAALRWFHQAFHQEQPPADLDEATLIDAYLAHLAQRAPRLIDILARVAKELVDRAVSELPIDALEDAPEAVHDLVRTSLMLPIERDGHVEALRFAQVRVGEHVVMQEMRRRLGALENPSAAEVQHWARVASEHPLSGIITGALEAWTAFLVLRGDTTIGINVADLEHDQVQTRLMRAVLRAYGILWGHDDQPAPGAMRLLEVMTAAGLRGDRGKRWIAASWGGLRWLVRNGHQAAAAELTRRLLCVARAPLSRPSEPAEDRRSLCEALNELGSLALAADEWEEARKCFEDAERVLKDLISTGNDGASVRRGLALSLRQRGALSMTRGAQTRAREQLEEALGLGRKTVDDDATSLEPREELIRVMVELGRLARRSGNLAHGRGYLEEALDLSRALLAEAPFAVDVELQRAEASRELAEVARLESREEEAEGRSETALCLLRDLVRKEPQRVDCCRSRAMLARQMAATARVEHRDSDARKLLEEAVEVTRGLAQSSVFTNDTRFELMGMLNELGILLRQCDEPKLARACFDEALRVARQQMAQGADPRRERAALVANLAHLEQALGKRPQALKLFSQAEEILREVDEPLDWVEQHRFRASLLRAIGRLSLTDDRDRARWHLEQAVRLLSEALAHDPHRVDLQWDINAALGDAALLQAANGANATQPPPHLFSVIVREPGTPEVREFFGQHEVTVGRAPRNELMLPSYSVSRVHAKIAHRDGGFFVEDLGSKHGTWLNGQKLDGVQRLNQDDVIEIGGFALQVWPAEAQPRGDIRSGMPQVRVMDDDWDEDTGLSAAPRASAKQAQS